MRRRLIYADSRRWAEIALNAEELMNTGDFSLGKNEGRVCAGVLKLEGASPAFVKRAETRSAPHGMWERVRGSRARRALRGAALLKAAGFAHPRPYGAIETLSAFGGVSASHLLNEALVNSRTLSVFGLGSRGELRRDMARRLRITKAVAKEVRRLHDAGLYTLDLQETNLMLEEDSAGFRIYFIDLEDIRRGRISMRRRLINLVHLDRSIGRFIGRAGRLRFLYSYLGEKPGRAETRRLIARLLAMRANLKRRSERKRERASSIILTAPRSPSGESVISR
ncbi:MAG: lipopolysaccharide kinase InaA family protein [Candidatus Binataceae bacterium]